LVIEPGGSAIAQVRSDGFVNGRKDLKKDEDRCEEGEGDGEVGFVLDCADEDAHGDGEDGGKDATESENGPPDGGEGAVGAGEDAGDCPEVT
jgi:hypothetical protein